MTQKEFDIIHDALTYALSRFETPYEYDLAMGSLCKEHPECKL